MPSLHAFSIAGWPLTCVPSRESAGTVVGIQTAWAPADPLQALKHLPLHLLYVSYNVRLVGMRWQLIIDAILLPCYLCFLLEHLLKINAF